VGPADRLDFQLCGELRVRRGGEDVVLHRTARKGRLALAYLVLNHDRVVTRDELMERLSTEPDPQRVGASVSQTLSRLRRVLGQERLERLPAGAVRLRGPLRVDVEHAEEMLRDGRRAVEGREWSVASQASEAVLDELAGEVLAGDEADWLEEVRRAVSDLRVEALELRATAALRMGSCAEALASARAAVALSATRQPAWALVMEAQARQGDVTGATETFHALRRKLMSESGLPVSRQLVELHDRIVAGEMSGNGHVPASVTFPSGLSFESGGEAFVGREATLDRLRHRYAHAKAGARQFVVLSGEPGIGKTRLASEFAHEAHADGAIVLYGRSDVETLVPYQPFVTAIGHYVVECGDGPLADELGAELSELSRLIPSLARRLPQLREPLAVEPEMRRFRLFNAVASVLAFVARDRPALLIMDDLQWADASTTLLLRHALEEIHDVRLLVLGTYRDAEGCESDRLADLLARPRPGFERIAVSGLDAEETAALVVARRRRAVPGDAVGALLEATGGNPLLLEEILKSLAATEPVSARAVRHVGLSEGAKQLIGGRLQRLDASAQRVLAEASVVGATFGVRVLEAVTDVSEDQVIEALEDAEAAGLVRELPDGDRYTFAHALVRDALLDGQSTARRRRLHHRIGEALEAGGETVHPAELAHHFIESARDTRKALEYSLEAGRRAAESLAYEDAAEHFERALPLLEDERPRCEALLELGRVQLRQGSPAARATFREASRLAERNGWPDLLGQAALGFASRYTEAGVVDTDGIALLRTARAAATDGAPALRAELTARLADSLHFAPEPGEAEQLSHEALGLALHEGDPHALAAAFESRHAALLCIDHLDERLWLSRQLIELARRERERELEALGRHWSIYDLLESADIEAAQEERVALATLADELRQPLYHHFSVGWDVVWAHLAGRVNEVEALAQRFYDLGIAAQARDTETIYHAQLIALRRRQERLPDFINTVQAAVAAHPTLLVWRAVVPLTHLASGDVRSAVAEFEWFAADRFGRVRRDMFWFATICVLAETCTLLRDTARAETLYGLLEPFKDRNVQVTQAACWGSVERFLGLVAAVLGRGETAVAHLESAIAKNEAGGNAAAASLVRRDLAKLLAANGGGDALDRAAVLLREPLRAARAAGSESLVARIEDEIESVERRRLAS
jgi:DNA-binding SARP family transcriptional activator